VVRVEELKSTLAPKRRHGAMRAPSMPGTAYVLSPRTWRTTVSRGVWGYVRGGMGGLHASAGEGGAGLGVEIRCDSEFAHPGPERPRRRRRPADGPEIDARLVASNADANVTCNRLLEPGVARDFAAAVKPLGYESATLKLTCLSERRTQGVPGSQPSTTAARSILPGSRHE